MLCVSLILILLAGTFTGHCIQSVCSGLDPTCDDTALAYVFLNNSGLLDAQEEVQRYLIFEANSSPNTAIVDFLTWEIVAGPAAPSGYGVNITAEPVESGTRSGAYWVLGTANNSNFFDPAGESFATGPGLDVNYGNNANAWVVSSGTHAGKIYIRFGQGWAGTDRYNPVTDTNETSPFASNGGSGIQGSHSFLVPSGPLTGDRMIIIAGTTTAEVYDPGTDTFIAGVAIGATPGTGSHSLALDNDTFIIPNGGGTAPTRLYDAAGNAFAGGPGLGCNCGNGCHSTRINGGINDGNFLFICGGSITATKIYDQSGGSFNAGPALTDVAGTGSQTITITAGNDAGKLWIIHGDAANTTSLFDPETETMSAGPTLPINPNGALSIPLP